MVGCPVRNKQALQQLNMGCQLLHKLLVADSASDHITRRLNTTLLSHTPTAGSIDHPPATSLSSSNALIVTVFVGLHTHYPDWCCCRIQESAETPPPRIPPQNPLPLGQ